MDDKNILPQKNESVAQILSLEADRILPQKSKTPGAAGDGGRDSHRGSNDDDITSLAHILNADIATSSSQAGWGAAIAERLETEGAAQGAAHALGAWSVAGHTLAQWAARYLATCVYGKARGTLEGKSRDLVDFVAWFTRRCGSGNIQAWCEADTRCYLRDLEKTKQPATINRALATLKHFARFVHDQPDAVFLRHGMPTAKVAALPVDEPACKKLSDSQVEALFAAAYALVARAAQARDVRGTGKAADPVHERARPQRNLALLGVLYYTGLRVSEALSLTRAQYDGTAFYNVARKGKRRSRKMLLHSECIRLLDAYVEQERQRDIAFLDRPPERPALPDASRPLFLAARSPASVDRARVALVLSDLARRASLSPDYAGEAFHVHPHRLRHTFGAEYREVSGSDTETAAALGHAGLAYVGRYARKTDAERLAVLEKAL